MTKNNRMISINDMFLFFIAVQGRYGVIIISNLIISNRLQIFE